VPGDNLWNFSEKHLDSAVRFEQLRRINNIEDQKHMRPGTRRRVRMDWIVNSAVPATVGSLYAAARVARSSGSNLPVEVGMQVFLGDSIRTDRHSSVASGPRCHCIAADL
jgi:hypothetical protein